MEIFLLSFSDFGFHINEGFFMNSFQTGYVLKDAQFFNKGILCLVYLSR